MDRPNPSRSCRQIIEDLDPNKVKKEKPRILWAMMIGQQWWQRPLGVKKPTIEHLYREAKRRYVFYQTIPRTQSPTKGNAEHLREWLLSHPINSPECLSFLRSEVEETFRWELPPEENEEDEASIPSGSDQLLLDSLSGMESIPSRGIDEMSYELIGSIKRLSLDSNSQSLTGTERRGNPDSSSISFSVVQHGSVITFSRSGNSSSLSSKSGSKEAFVLSGVSNLLVPMRSGSFKGNDDMSADLSVLSYASIRGPSSSSSVTNNVMGDAKGATGSYRGTLSQRNAQTNFIHMPHGNGKMKYRDGTVYDGEWHFGNWHGHGMLTFPFREGYYAGSFKRFCRDGRGLYHRASGAVYEGEWKDDKRHGEGTQVYHRGDTYNGEWKDDFRHGQGSLRSKSGVYNGSWVANQKNGEGVFQHASGWQLDGVWMSDRCVGPSPHLDEENTCSGLIMIMGSFLKLGSAKDSKQVEQAILDFTKCGGMSWLKSVSVETSATILRTIAGLESSTSTITNTIMWLLGLSQQFSDNEALQAWILRWVAEAEKNEGTCKSMISNGALPQIGMVLTRYEGSTSIQGLGLQLLTGLGLTVDLERIHDLAERPLLYASRHGNEMAVCALLEGGASIDMKDKDGYTALHRASMNGHEAVVDVLLKGGASIDMTDNKGRTALHVASEYGHQAVVDVSWKGGVSIDMKMNDRWTG